METSQLLDMLPQAAFLVRDGVIAYVNPAAAGCLLEAGTPIETLLHTGIQEYGALTDGELCLQLQLHTTLWDATVRRSADGDLFLLDQPREDPALQALALAAMELRTPLNDAFGATDRLLAESQSMDAALIQRSLYQLLRQVGNMADAVRYGETAQSEVQNICAVLDEIFEKAAAAAQQAGVTLCYKGLEKTFLCSVDRERLERGVYNLIVNAVKFSEAGAVIEASLQQRGRQLALTVRDTGSGIPAALQGSLFRRYQRQPGIEDPRHGLGLGMVMIRAAAAAHGGTVLIRTDENGTQVTLTFSLSVPAGRLRSPLFRVDYAGERDHCLVELSQILPPEAYL